MKPVYVRFEKEGHGTAWREFPESVKQSVKETYEPAFFASDIEKLIKGSIDYHQKRHGDEISHNILIELRGLLSALESPKDGAEGKGN